MINQKKVFSCAVVFTLILSVTASFLIQTTFGTALIDSNWETGTVTDGGLWKYSSKGYIQMESHSPIAGSYSLRVNAVDSPSKDTIYISHSPLKAELWSQGLYKFTDFGSNYIRNIVFHTDDWGNKLGGWGVKENGQIYIRYGLSNTEAVSQTKLSTNKVYNITFYFKCHDKGALTLWVNGNEVTDITKTGVDTRGAVDVEYTSVGCEYAFGADYIIDNVKVQDQPFSGSGVITNPIVNEDPVIVEDPVVNVDPDTTQNNVNTITSYSVSASSGTISALRTAISQVISHGGGTVYVPQGTFTFDVSDSYNVDFNVPSGGLRIVGAGMGKTILQVPTRRYDDGSPMFVFDGQSGGRLIISGITFKGNPDRTTSTGAYTGIQLESCTDYRITDCSFYDMGGHGIAIADGNNMFGNYGGDLSLVSQGVIDHCEFHKIYKPKVTAARTGWGYGVFVGLAWADDWAVPNIYPTDVWSRFGKYYKNNYIEDCYFEGCRHAVTANFAGAYVLRYSTIEDQGMYSAVTTGHPSRLNTIGMYCQEIYSNTIRNTGTYTNKHPGFSVEAGSSLIYNNIIENIGAQVLFVGSSETVNDFFPLGNINNVFFWNNQIRGSTMSTVYVNQNAGGLPVEGVNYWTDITGAYSTTQIQSIINSKGYTPYTYPHPLTQ